MPSTCYAMQLNAPNERLLRTTREPPTPGIIFEQLDAQAMAISDNEAAHRLNQARVELFQTIYKVRRPAA